MPLHSHFEPQCKSYACWPPCTLADRLTHAHYSHGAALRKCHIKKPSLENGWSHLKKKSTCMWHCCRFATSVCSLRLRCRRHQRPRHSRRRPPPLISSHAVAIAGPAAISGGSPSSAFSAFAMATSVMALCRGGSGTLPMWFCTLPMWFCNVLCKLHTLYQ